MLCLFNVHSQDQEKDEFQIKICFIHAKHRKPKLVLIAVHKCKEKCKISLPSY